jgi:hypothetical protein
LPFTTMAMTIDHLRVDHRITVLRDFSDGAGVALRAGERGVLRGLSFDQIRLEIRMEIERENGKVELRFPLRAASGPRNGHMKEYFELGDHVRIPGTEPVRRDPAVRRMIVPAPENQPDPKGGSDRRRLEREIEGPDRLEELEQQILRDTQHIGGAASIAEVYAQRMRAFQRAGDEARAVAAFKLATQWMWTYASQATSGGEGEALSHERDQFHAALVREFGYDPTANSP